MEAGAIWTLALMAICVIVLLILTDPTDYDE